MSDERFVSSPLLTSHCVKCDYSLECLPRDAKCPECGMAIDDRFVVIRGKTPDVQSGLESMTFFVAMMSYEAAQTFLFRRRLSGFPAILFLVVWINIWSPYLFVSLWRRWTLEGPPHQLWICDDGFWVRRRAAVFESRAGRRMVLTVTTGALIAVIAASFIQSAVWGVASTVAVTLAAFMAFLTRRENLRETLEIDVAGVGLQRCMLWRRALATSVWHLKENRYRVTIEPRPPGFFNVYRRGVSRFLADLDERDANALRTRLTQMLQQHG